VVHDVAAVGIDKAQQEIEPGGDPDVHHVGMPGLLATFLSQLELEISDR
jgi:hypothetical protein